MITKQITHTDGITKVIATGYVNDKCEFVGEYKYDGMTYGATIPVGRDFVNYLDVLQQMKGNEEATRTCLKMMTWLIKDIEVDKRIDLKEYKDIWEKAFAICK